MYSIICPLQMLILDKVLTIQPFILVKSQPMLVPRFLSLSFPLLLLLALLDGVRKLLGGKRSELKTFQGINMALVFNMGTDLESIMSNPIGQPLATVRATGHIGGEVLTCFSDFFQQFRKTRNFSPVVFHYHRPVYDGF